MNSINRYKIIFFIFLSLIIFFHAYASEKKSVEITGDNLKTKSYSAKNGEKIYFTELTGNPMIKTDNKELYTDKIVCKGNNGEIVEALGNVILIDKIKGSRIKSGRAVFDREKNIIEFYEKPNAVIKREDDNSIVNIHADMMKYDIDGNTAEADGKVKLKNNDLDIYSEKAVFKRDAGIAVFTQNPEIRRGEDIFNADEITYYTDKKLLILDKNARVKTYSQEKDKETNKINKVLTKASGDRIEHYDDEKLTIIKGNAVIDREDSVSTGNRFEMRGQGSSQDLTGSNVHINYKVETMEAYGDNFKSYKKDGYSVLWGNTCMIIRDRKTDNETSRIYGDYMEHYEDIDELYISGNVSIIRDDGIIKGDMARYEHQNNILTVTGNARIEKDKSIVLAQAITIDTKTSDTRLYGDIRGRGEQ